MNSCAILQPSCHFNFGSERIPQGGVMRRTLATCATILALLVLKDEAFAQPCSLDASFNPALNSGAAIYVLTLQTDGQILIGGDFQSIGGVPAANVARLNPDGTLDRSFNPGAAVNV